MKRIFSGVQPSGDLHLGNYLGAIRRFVDLQADNDCIYCVVDLHAITVWQDPAELRQRTREVTAGYLAAGIDPKKSIIFNQSQVAAHAELAWVFNCVTRLGWLNRMTQFKDKAGKNREKASSGLYVYPNLMAADILVYKGTHVPVGEDQKQHLELTRDIAQKFNNDFGVEYFPIVEPLIQGAAPRVMSLRDGTKKMSSSDPSDAARINMTDDADAVAKKVRRATSDAELLPDPSVIGPDGQFTAEFRQSRPEAANLLTIFAALSGQTLADTVGAFEGKGFADFKKEMTDVAVAALGPMGAEMKRMVEDPSHVDSVLRDGAERARALADPILAEVYDIVGFLRP
ncbi:tryptophan--tRNA ligase [Pelagibius litoralis]|uniref:Tryptophan--tRNA ligase n=1 Tax=Pelagibius litoralis TaxID=374515 RepID=A0A967F312_9PROT|nr:tryptophan--tRNA ligase [Pelagibius litoralis]NIA71961.1 tryptophan--tRNA ligase [Pelagibius litoralis]